MNTTTIETTDETSEERGLALRRDARAAAAVAGGELLAKAFHCIDNMKELEVVAINRMREAGNQFILASGRQRLLFDDAGLEFTRKEILPHLPDKASIEHVRFAVRIAVARPTPFETVEELRAFRPELQQMLALCGLGEAPRRRELQSAHARNWWADVVSKIADLRTLEEKIEAEEPMENWGPDKLDEYLENNAWKEERITKARRLLLGLGKKAEGRQN